MQNGDHNVHTPICTVFQILLICSNKEEKGKIMENNALEKEVVRKNEK